jgi:threonyl-tRNA synthetase
MDSSLDAIRNSTAKLLAIAVGSLFPKVQLVSGQSTNLGFYYDFYFAEPISEDQLSVIEERMRDFMRQDLPFRTMEMMRKNAMELFKYHKQDLKVALLKENLETLVHLCQIGHYYELGYPPFVESTKQVGSFKLLNISYLKRSLPGRPNLNLTRIKGTAFPDSKQLKAFLKVADEAKEKDPILLGQEMAFFAQFDPLAPQAWCWLPKGAVFKEQVIAYWKQEYETQKFEPVCTANLLKSNQRYPTFSLNEGENYTFANNKATQHGLIYRSKQRDLEDLPVRFSEWDTFYSTEITRQETDGPLNSVSFTSDKAFTFCSSGQLLGEIISSLHFIDKTFKIFGFEVHWHLNERRRKTSSSSKLEEEALQALAKALKHCGFEYALDNEASPYYGPSIEACFVDTLGRRWKGSSLYIDLQTPEKLGLHYHDSNSKVYTPYMVGRSIFCSLERFSALLIERYEGLIPLWLAPEQVRVLPVGEKHKTYAMEIEKELKNVGIRAQVNAKKESLSVKTREADKERVPIVVIAGDPEEATKTLSIRHYKDEKIEAGVDKIKFIEHLLEKIKAKLKEAY